MEETFTLESHFSGKEPVVRALYDHMLASLRKFGKVIEEPKKTSIHLVNVSAFAGVQTRGAYILLNIKADRKIESARIHKGEQISAKRFHHRVKISSLSEIDNELLGWLQEAYDLSGKK
ncbi:MAG: hypothetical protein HZB50_01415 [Chloroflexi bacterium]|nr:hypothetical protein [Chloroflexota bacterium]